MRILTRKEIHLTFTVFFFLFFYFKDRILQTDYFNHFLYFDPISNMEHVEKNWKKGALSVSFRLNGLEHLKFDELLPNKRSSNTTRSESCRSFQTMKKINVHRPRGQYTAGTTSTLQF